MFKLNEVTRTKNGELLKPFSIQGNIILCADKNGNTVKRTFGDFDFKIQEEKEVVSVIPQKRTEEVVVTEENKNDDTLFTPEEEPVEGDNTSEPVEEPVEEPSEEDTTNSSGSIWDDVDDGYI